MLVSLRCGGAEQTLVVAEGRLTTDGYTFSLPTYAERCVQFGQPCAWVP